MQSISAKQKMKIVSATNEYKEVLEKDNEENNEVYAKKMK